MPIAIVSLVPFYLMFEQLDVNYLSNQHGSNQMSQSEQFENIMHSSAD